jgi:hypothetical protein
MRLTIVADDNAVGIDGKFFSPLDLSRLDPSIHAVQWYGDYGEVEFRPRREGGVLITPSNVLITDIAPYQFAVDMWNAAKAVDEVHPPADPAPEGDATRPAE